MSQDWLSTDLIYFQILIPLLLFGIFVEYKIQEMWKIIQETALRYVYEDYESTYDILLKEGKA